MIDPELLKILCCPENHQPLTEADAGLVRRLNEEIRAGRLRNRAGQPVADLMDGGLVREDGQYLYPIRGKIPILLIADAIPL